MWFGILVFACLHRVIRRLAAQAKTSQAAKTGQVACGCSFGRLGTSPARTFTARAGGARRTRSSIWPLSSYIRTSLRCVATNAVAKIVALGGYKWPWSGKLSDLPCGATTVPGQRGYPCQVGWHVRVHMYPHLPHSSTGRCFAVLLVVVRLAAVELAAVLVLLK